jgi:aminoglycoside 3-N-acetyltransferase
VPIMLRTSKRALKAALGSMDLPKNHIYMIHSSMLKFGLFEDGLEGFMEVLYDALGAQSSIVMPAFTFKNMDNIWRSNDSRSQMGALTEYFRRHVAEGRSCHPLHSVCYSGPISSDVAPLMSLSSFGDNSVFEFLVNNEAINLSLGTDFVGGASYLHLAEEQESIFYRAFVSLDLEVYDADNRLINDKFKYFARSCDDLGIEYKNEWAGLENALQDSGLLRVNNDLSAPIRVSPMLECIKFFSSILKNNPRYVLGDNNV